MLPLFGKDLKTMENAFSCKWELSFEQGVTFEEARLYSLPGKELKSAQELVLVDDMADIGKLVPGGHIPAQSTAVVRGTFESDTDGEMIITAGADWWFHGFINGVPFGDTEASGNAAHPISALDQIYLVKFQKGTNIITFHLRAGVNWHFGVTLLPMPQKLPRNFRVINSIAAVMLEKDFHLEHDPLVFNVSADKANVAVEFSIPALCGIRITPADGGKSVTKWSKVCGLREYRQIHHFAFDGLNAGTSYNYEILNQNEKLGVEKVIYSGKFTTFPAKADAHRFTVFSDTQLATAAKTRALEEFIANTPVKKADFIVALGDMASGFGNFSEAYFTGVIDVLRANGVLQPLEMVRGNHELWGAEAQLYSAFFGLPYGAFTFGDTFYIRLDSGEDQPPVLSPDGRTQKSDLAEYYAEQAAWLEKVVATPECRNAKRRIVLAHATPFEFHGIYTAGNIQKMVGKLFYGENPVCKIDLWIAGHIHYPMYFDPVGGKIYGLHPKKELLVPTENDLKNIHFPVYVNDGPHGGGSELSVLDIDCRIGDIVVRCLLRDGKTVDEVVIAPGKAVEVKQSEFDLLWSK